MLAGGEEYFQPPEPIDTDSLARFAAWCRRLRALEKPGQQSIATLCRDADAVGAPMHVKEIVAGTVLRCIKHSSGNKRYAYWCLLDKMAKEFRSTFAFLFEQHLADVAADCIDWEDPVLASKYEVLLEHWDAVFDRSLVQQLWTVRRKERLWAAKHPEEAKRQREDEEAVWDSEIEKLRDETGLDTYGEPCLEYLKGQCEWGAACTQLHPPGLENTLPPEARLGDWRCPGCGMINRHFRRRCFSCVREKPQYKKGQAIDKTPEVIAVTKADDAFLAPLSAQFGYDPCNVEAAIRHWRERLATPAQVAEYIEARRRRYQSEILPHIKPDSSAAASIGGGPVRRDRDANSTSINQSETQRSGNENNSRQQTSAGPKTTVEISASAAALTGSASDRLAALTTSILEDGVHAPNFLKTLFLLSKVVGELAAENRAGQNSNNNAVVDNADLSLMLFEVCRMVHTAWLATGRKRPHAAIPFLTAVQKDIDALPLTAEHKSDIGNMAASVE